MKIRTGLGYDVHRLAKDETLIIGGVPIPHETGTVAHSDGDVLIHALCDALLGAAALGDIGYHFPDTDPKNKNRDSKVLLVYVMQMLAEKGYQLGNADLVIVAQKPKMAPYITTMRKVLARLMKVEEEQVSVKATTTEGLGFVGQQAGIAAYATVLIEKTDQHE